MKILTVPGAVSAILRRIFYINKLDFKRFAVVENFNDQLPVYDTKKFEVFTFLQKKTAG